MVFGLVFTPDESSEILKLIDQLLIVGGIAATYYGRYRQGDINAFGLKK